MALKDCHDNAIMSQAPPAAFSSRHLIFLIFAGAGTDGRLWMCRFNGAEFDPPKLIFPDQFVRPAGSPCVAQVDDKVFLVWPGSGFNGYFYAVGTIGAPDEFGSTIVWNGGRIIPGTESLEPPGVIDNLSVAGFKTNSASGFVFVISRYDPASDQRILSYMVYDNAKSAFTTDSPIDWQQPILFATVEIVLGCTLVVADDLVIPVMVDRAGNITYYQLDNAADNYGRFADWLQCAIGSSGGGGIDASVGIPPSISVGGTIDTNPTPLISAATIYPGTNGGALICGQFYDPVFGNNSLGFAAVAINFKVLAPP